MRAHQNHKWVWLVELVGAENLSAGEEYYFQQRLNPPGLLYVGGGAGFGFYVKWWDLV